MKELSAIVGAFAQALSEGKACALATVVAVSGSAYRPPGARMLITEEGQTTGGISGGCLERDVILRARRVIRSGEPALAVYDAVDEEDLESSAGSGCHGVVEILIEPLPQPEEQCHLMYLEERLRRRETSVLATVWRTSGQIETRAGSRLLRSPRATLWDGIRDPQLRAQIDEDALEVLQGGRSESRTYHLPDGRAEVFLEVLRPAVPLVVFGGGRDAVPLVRLARELGWHGTVVDGGPAPVIRSRFVLADAVISCGPEQVREQVPLGSDTAAVVMTHNYRTDLQLLAALLPSPVRYLGLLGPKSRAERLLRDLAQAGIHATPEHLRRLHAPVGLDLGAETPEEIALAILAEIKAVLAGRAGGSLKERRTPIHERAQPVEAVGDNPPCPRSPALVGG